MSKIVSIRDAQSYFDLSLMLTGSIEGVFDVAGQAPVSTEPQPGTMINTGSITVIEQVTLNYYNTRRIIPATGLAMTQSGIPEGIGYWYVGEDFVVN